MDPAVDDVKTKLPKVAKVKNKMPAPVQITAEQLLREAKERELELVQPPPKQKISDPDELQAYRLRKRKMFEDNIRKNRSVMTNWIKYAQWEESQKEIQRARSVYERALDVDHRNITVWLKYAEMEMKCRQVNHARNVWDRAVTILPRANQFWYKYTYMEEMLKNIAGARQVFERWMEWEPDEQAWHSYINFELRYKELDRARGIYERFVITHPEVKNWIKYAKFEQKNGYINSARRIYERAVEFFGEDNMNEQILLAFAKFEESQKEHERARVIYKYALDHLGKDACQEVYKQYTIHEKKYGDRTAIEDVIVSKRKFQYEEAVKANPHDYDSWFDYLRLMESDGEVDQIREVYERAIANVPPSKVKRHWRRYIYLWIYYAVFEELVTEDYDRCEQVYQACLDLIPHKKFTFAKIWLLYAQFQIRQKNLGKARKILGTSIGKCPKDKLFRGYIDLEIQLREFERCRILYEKFLEFSPENCTTWMKFAELENILGDTERARAIFELAIAQPRLDMPEVLWKAYIDFEIEQEEYDRTRALYRRLLQRTQHVKVWISFAQFELSTGAEDAISKTRAIYREGNKALKSCEDKEERLMLLESWRQFEHEYGDEASQAAVHKMLPNKVKRRRKVKTEDGADAGWEEYFDYIFPDDEAAQPNLKLLAIAKKWKQKGDLDTITNDVNDSSSSSSESENENEEENEEQSGTKTLTNGNNVEQNLEKSDPGEVTGSGHNDVHRRGDTDSEGVESDSDSSSSSSSDNDKKSNDRKKKSTNNKSERRTRKRSSNSSSRSSSSSSSSNNSSDDNNKKSSHSSSGSGSSSESEGES